MTDNYKIHFKECSPEETVAKLKGILDELGIEIEEESRSTSSINTNSMRIVMKGTNWGSNGKGVSPIYCEASAYAEFIERYQNDLMPYWICSENKPQTFFRSFDEKIIDTSEIVSDESSFIRAFFEKREMQSATFIEKVDRINDVQRQDFWLYGIDGKYVCIPFYSVKEKKVTYLPYCMYSTYYGSNGMCAGNTDAEALVQGLSEIFERVAQKRILTEQPTLPDIPDEYIERFPRIKSLYSELKKNTKFRYYLKDCSFGGQYPVAALIIVERNTGRFGIKLGCHPDYSIAMERCFTEATQGQDIADYSKSSIVDFSNARVSDDSNICNSFKCGKAQFPYQIFGTKPTYEFTPMPDVSALTNQEILDRWICEIIDSGFDVLVRNASFLGFPSFHIIIPGLSELQDANDKRCRANNTKLYVQQLLLHPEKINQQNIRYIIVTLQYFSDIGLENALSNYYPQSDNFPYPCSEFGKDLFYMQAMCCAFANDYSKAANIVRNLCLCAYRSDSSNENIPFYDAVYHYFTAMNTIGVHDTVLKYLSVFYSKEICDRINSIFKDKLSIFLMQFPVCENDSEIHGTQYEIIDFARRKLLEKQVQSGIRQEDLAMLFK